MGSNGNILRFMQNNRALRPNARVSYVDFVIEKSFPERAQGTPWVVTEEMAKQLISNSTSSNEKLESFFSAESWKKVKEDQRWWDYKKYSNKKIEESGCIKIQETDLNQFAFDALVALERLDKELFELKSRFKTRDKRSSVIYGFKEKLKILLQRLRAGR